MLKCVVFAVTEYGLAYLLEKRDSIEKTLRTGAVETVFMTQQDHSEKYLKEQMLFITDDAEILKQLLKEEYYAIGLYHDKNKGVYFEDTLYVVEDVEQLTFKAYDEVYRRLAGLPWDILETEHLVVRESTQEDVKEFYRIYKEPSITYYMEDLFQDPAEETVYMEAYIKQIYEFYGFGIWTVLHKETGEVIGRAGLNVREGYDLPELGFVIDVQYQGRGYAFEVCSAILDYAREELLFEKVQALVKEENERSVKLLNKLSFEYEKDVLEKGQEYRLMIKRL